MTKQIHDDHKVTPDEHLQNYTKHSFRVNDALYYGHRYGDEVPANIKRQVEHIKSKLGSAKYPFTVYTGIKWNPVDAWDKHGVDYENDLIIKLPAFTSCSTDIEVACSFARMFNAPMDSDVPCTVLPNAKKNYASGDMDMGHVIELRIKPSDKISSVAHFSEHPSEEEMILDSGVDIEIYPNPKIKQIDGLLIAIWTAKIK